MAGNTLEFDEVPMNYRKFAILNEIGEQIGWIMAPSEYEALSDWNRPGGYVAVEIMED